MVAFFCSSHAELGHLRMKQGEVLANGSQLEEGEGGSIRLREVHRKVGSRACRLTGKVARRHADHNRDERNRGSLHDGNLDGLHLLPYASLDPAAAAPLWASRLRVPFSQMPWSLQRGGRG